MATPIIPESDASLQSPPAELEHILQEAAENNVDLLAAFHGVGQSIFEEWTDFVSATNQAVELDLISKEQSQFLMQAYATDVFEPIPFKLCDNCNEPVTTFETKRRKRTKRLPSEG